MVDREWYTAGQVFTPKNVATLFAILTENFAQTQVRESSHYSTGKYVRINFPSDIEFFFEPISDDEYLMQPPFLPQSKFLAAERLAVIRNPR